MSRNRAWGLPISAAQLVFSEQGTVAATIDLNTSVDQVHLLRTCDILFAKREITCHAVVAHADGSLVTGARPAHGGEEIVLYAFGLGGTTANPSTGRAPTEAVPTFISFTITFDPRENALSSRAQMRDPPTPRHSPV